MYAHCYFAPPTFGRMCITWLNKTILYSLPLARTTPAHIARLSLEINDACHDYLLSAYLNLSTSVLRLALMIFLSTLTVVNFLPKPTSLNSIMTLGPRYGPGGILRIEYAHIVIPKLQPCKLVVTHSNLAIYPS